jgi:hypothetical protein
MPHHVPPPCERRAKAGDDETSARRVLVAFADAALDLLVQAVAAADDIATDMRAVTWRKPLATLAATSVSAAEAGPRRGTIRQHGSRWEIALDGQRLRVRALVGMTYLAQLLTRPGQPIPSLTLASQGSAPRPPSHQEVLDGEARAAYATRAQELAAELTEAEAHHDLGRADKLRVELDMLVAQLEAATGLHNRPRTFTDPGERARSAVSKAIKRAIDAIDDANPMIAEAIRGTVTTGVTCMHTPDPRVPIIWSTRETETHAAAVPVRPSMPPRAACRPPG